MSMKTTRFNSESAARKWMKSNAKKSSGVWIEFYKNGYGENGVTQKQAVDLALCHGWTFAVIKSLSHDTYAIHFTPRKPKSGWSASMVKRFKELKKLGLVSETGLKAFAQRKVSVYENPNPTFTPAHLRRFKANKKAWAFFSSQTESYRKYMCLWVLSAKQATTQEKRLQELISHSAAGTKLKRIEAANARMKEKRESRFASGQTPVEEGKNLGPKIGSELRSLGIMTLEQLKREGWESVITRWTELYPQRVNLIAIKAMIGAVEDTRIRDLDSELSANARTLLYELKHRREY
jgi:uncharacterized protein YdeI (YjbR/CyaY-like superfamily)